MSIDLPSLKKFHLVMEDNGYTSVMYEDYLIVSMKNPDLYNIRVKDGSFVYYPEPDNHNIRIGYYRSYSSNIMKYTEELVDGVWKVRSEKAVIF